MARFRSLLALILFFAVALSFTCPVYALGDEEPDNSDFTLQQDKKDGSFIFSTESKAWSSGYRYKTTGFFFTLTPTKGDPYSVNPRSYLAIDYAKDCQEWPSRIEGKVHFECKFNQEKVSKVMFDLGMQYPTEEAPVLYASSTFVVSDSNGKFKSSYTWAENYTTLADILGAANWSAGTKDSLRDYFDHKVTTQIGSRLKVMSALEGQTSVISEDNNTGELYFKDSEDVFSSYWYDPAPTSPYRASSGGWKAGKTTSDVVLPRTVDDGFGVYKLKSSYLMHKTPTGPVKYDFRTEGQTGFTTRAVKMSVYDEYLVGEYAPG